MANITWEKSAENVSRARLVINKRAGYMVVGLALLAVVALLVISGTATARYYITVDELVANPDHVGKNVRVAGAVIGDSIHFDPDTNILTFTVVHIPNSADDIQAAGGLGAVLHEAVNNPQATRLNVVWENAEVPDLLQHEAQAIMSGRYREDGTFMANEVLLKCPTRYSDEAPKQAVQE